MRISTILVIEDDREIRETLRDLLESEGYQVFTAVNGKDGIEVLGRIARPCLILLDLMMPVCDGWRFRELQKQNLQIATIPVVTVSASRDDRALEAGGTKHLRKPIEMHTLLNTIKDFCN